MKRLACCCVVVLMCFIPLRLAADINKSLLITRQAVHGWEYATAKICASGGVLSGSTLYIQNSIAFSYEYSGFLFSLPASQASDIYSTFTIDSDGTNKIKLLGKDDESGQYISNSSENLTFSLLDSGNSSNNKSYAINVVVDNSGPTGGVITTSPEHGYFNNNTEYFASGVTLTASGASDSGCGFSNNYSWTSENVYSTGDYSCTATDLLGNSSVFSKHIDIDSTAPTTPTLSGGGGGWQNHDVTITASSSDAQSDIAGYAFSTDNNTWTDYGSEKYTVSASGITHVYCKAKDNVGNVSDSSSGTEVKIDHEAPTLSAPSASIHSDKATQKESIVVTWTAHDDKSGLASCLLEYSENGTTWPSVPSRTTDNQQVIAPETLANLSTTSTIAYTATIPLDAFPALYGKTVVFRVTAQDGVNNSATSNSSDSLVVPPELSFAPTLMPVGTTQQSDQDYMEVDLAFGVAPEKLQMLSSLTVARVLAAGNANTTDKPITLPASFVIDPSTIPSSIGASTATSAGGNLWKEDSSGNIVYVDYVPVPSGAGHKDWVYSLGASTQAGVPWYAIANPSQNVGLPNNRGTLPFDASCIVDASVKHNVCGSEGFTIGATGAVVLRLQGSDPDGDTWHVKVYRVRKIVQDGYEFTSYTVLSGENEVRYSYPYAQVEIPINLYYGNNDIQVVWTEGDGADDAATSFYSSIKNLKFEHTIDGKYVLTVHDSNGNEAPDSSAGILCAPQQPLVLTLTSAQNDTTGTKWDFGDGTAGSGDSVSHPYAQKADQNEAYCLYTLTLTLPNGTDSSPATSIPLVVKVLDTQEGKLWGDEVWRGPHSVVGTVIVPSGKTLSIETNAAVPTEVVSLTGDSAAGYKQGVTVNEGGALRVSGGVSFQPAAGQSFGWGAILVKGTASIGAEDGSVVTIAKADRGIAVAATGTVTVVNANFLNNVTGLQVYGSTAKVLVKKCSFSGNSVYGIKEDALGRPTVQNSSFSANFRSYYQYNGGVIAIDALNSLNAPNNYGNQGE